MANTNKRVLFLPPSDAYVRSFLYLLYTLIKFYYTKLWVIKPRLWPRIEFFSSGDQESRGLCIVQQQPFNFMASRWGNSGSSGWLYFGVSKITADGDCSHEIKRHLLHGRKVMTNLDSILKSRDITLLTKVLGHMVVPVVVQMEELDCNDGWVPKNWCFWAVVLE